MLLGEIKDIVKGRIITNDANIIKCPECGQSMNKLSGEEVNTHIDGEIRKLYASTSKVGKITNRVIALEQSRKKNLYKDKLSEEQIRKELKTIEKLYPNDIPGDVESRYEWLQYELYKLTGEKFNKDKE